MSRGNTVSDNKISLKNITKKWPSIYTKFSCTKHTKCVAEI